MKPWARTLAGAIAAAAVLAVMAAAGARISKAESCQLELKRIESSRGSRADYMFRSVFPQHFYMQVTSERTFGQSSDFPKIIKSEPEKYHSKHPFRGVAKLGTGQYGFVLDAEDEKSKGYGRLLFDFNENGDLTDDKVIQGQQGRAYSDGSSRHSFPTVEVTVDADGKKLDYAFTISVNSNYSEDHSYASASIDAAAYREGRITLDGRTRRIVLLDFNSNGRFDDEFKFNQEVRTIDGQLHPTYGDVLLIDPVLGESVYRSPYDVTTSDDQHFVGKLVCIDGRFYDVQVSAAGDELTLTPSSVAVGQVTNPHGDFRAAFYGEMGFLKITGSQSKPATLPEGDWKLFSYTIDRTGYQDPESEPDEGQGSSVLNMLAGALIGEGGPGRRHTIVSARTSGSYQPVAVREGQTVTLPFGPPYKPVVKTIGVLRADQPAYLQLAIVGSAEEICTNMSINGQRPASPTFTISTPDGKEVLSSAFRFG